MKAIFGVIFICIFIAVSCDVVSFTSESDLFDLALKENKSIFVKHFEQWCGHCKALAPKFLEASNSVDDEVIFLEVECSKTNESKEFCQNQGVRGYPTLKIFEGEWVDYQGARDVDTLVKFALDHKTLKAFNKKDFITIEEPVEEPIETSIKPVTFAQVQSGGDPKIVVFGDIFEKASQKAYSEIETALELSAEFFPYPAVRVEKYNKKNAEFFAHWETNPEQAPPLPMVFVVAPGSPNPQRYGGPVTAKRLTDFLEDLLIEPDYSLVGEFENDKKLIALSKQKPVLVKHFEQWCGHCKALKPHFAKAAARAGDDVAFIEVECSKDDTTKKFCQKQKVKGYPTLKLIVDGKWHDYSGARTAQEMADFALSFVKGKQDL
ncbi:Protein disulfide-isomerase A6-like protein [Aduncisulcus paluster]|uniref:Protein disulfide-isomerase A6-like protein n=1 Tax=Aduncisulcus paluster TaxID=2918883 RepID=A0ABQ5KT60_9EUKA|nr:Protein disulfide-isomerase A6-like protein [Aduncisulcus paluster]